MDSSDDLWASLRSACRCRLCSEVMSDAKNLSCGHMFCERCLLRATKDEYLCPECRVPFLRRDLTTVYAMRDVANLLREYAVGTTVRVSRDFRVGMKREGGVATVVAVRGGAYDVKYSLGGSDRGLRADDLELFVEDTTRRRTVPRDFLVPLLDNTNKDNNRRNNKKTANATTQPRKTKRRNHPRTATTTSTTTTSTTTTSTTTMTRKRSASAASSSSSAKKRHHDAPERRIVMTGLKTDALARAGLALCGREADPTRATHVVVGKLRRTPKLLAAVAAGAKFVVDVDWLRESARQGRALDEGDFEARDPAKERAWGVDLGRTLGRDAPNFFRGLAFVVHSGNFPDDLRVIVRAAGGVFAPSPTAVLSRFAPSPTSHTLFVLTTTTTTEEKDDDQTQGGKVTLYDVFLANSLRRRAYLDARLDDLFPGGVAFLDSEAFYAAILNKTPPPLPPLRQHVEPLPEPQPGRRDDDDREDDDRDDDDRQDDREDDDRQDDREDDDRQDDREDDPPNEDAADLVPEPVVNNDETNLDDDCRDDELIAPAESDDFAFVPGPGANNDEANLDDDAREDDNDRQDDAFTPQPAVINDETNVDDDAREDDDVAFTPQPAVKVDETNLDDDARRDKVNEMTNLDDDAREDEVIDETNLDDDDDDAAEGLAPEGAVREENDERAAPNHNEYESDVPILSQAESSVAVPVGESFDARLEPTLDSVGLDRLLNWAKEMDAVDDDQRRLSAATKTTTKPPKPPELTAMTSSSSMESRLYRRVIQKAERVAGNRPAPPTTASSSEEEYLAPRREFETLVAWAETPVDSQLPPKPRESDETCLSDDAQLPPKPRDSDETCLSDDDDEEEPPPPDPPRGDAAAQNDEEKPPPPEPPATEKEADAAPPTERRGHSSSTACLKAFIERGRASSTKKKRPREPPTAATHASPTASTTASSGSWITCKPKQREAKQRRIEDTPGFFSRLTRPFRRRK